MERGKLMDEPREIVLTADDIIFIQMMLEEGLMELPDDEEDD
jgi:hypothetical protein